MPPLDQRGRSDMHEDDAYRHRATREGRCQDRAGLSGEDRHAWVSVVVGAARESDLTRQEAALTRARAK